MLSWRDGWTEAHQDACQRSIKFLLRQPWSSLMTIIMLAVTLMLAAFCWIATQHFSDLHSYWHHSETMSLYLRESVTKDQQTALMQKIQALSQVESAVLTSPEEGLALLAQQEGMQDIAQSLPYNPLPAVIQVIPNVQLQSPEALQHLFQQLQALPDVQQAKFDSDWVERLYAGLSCLKQLVQILTVLFALSVVLVIGNTLRLLIHNRQDEIQVLQLLGAPKQFIMRPYLFSSLWYGLFASILAIILVDAGLLVVRSGLSQWAESYHLQLNISLLPIIWALGLTGIAIFLSWTAARLTLHYYL